MEIHKGDDGYVNEASDRRKKRVECLLRWSHSQQADFYQENQRQDVVLQFGDRGEYSMPGWKELKRFCERVGWELYKDTATIHCG